MSPIRLRYRLHTEGRSTSVHVDALLAPGEAPLGDADLRRLMPTLHALDQAITREMRSGTTFGQLTEAQLARLLPLLAQRPTTIGTDDLHVLEEPLSPRMRIEARGDGSLEVRLSLHSETRGWYELDAGRLVIGAQAFWLQGGDAAPVVSPNPWELTSWVRDPMRRLGAELSPAERDALVSSLTRAGVPPKDLELLAVRRAPPERFIVRLLPVETEADEPLVRMTLEAQYAGQRVTLTGRAPMSPYLLPQPGTHGALIERDLATELDAREVMRRVGARFDPEAQLFVSRGQTALAVADPRTGVFPDAWLVDRSDHAPHFRQDLHLRAEVRLEEHRGLLDLQLGVRESPDELVDLASIAELLEWMRRGDRYLRLVDGSYVAPSAKFRRSLRILDDLGATSSRLLVSPLCIGLLRALGNVAQVAAADAATETWLAELAGLEAPREVPVPEGLRAQLRDYQRRGLDWLMMLHRHRLTGILADDMGLGKTVQALALLLAVRESDGHAPSLVVAPTSVLGVWRDEAARFAPSLKVVVWHGTPKAREALHLDGADVIVTSYGILRRDVERLASTRFRYLILDEAQSAKNAATQNARVVRKIVSERRLALSGTPIENHPEELWAAFDFLAPGFLGSLRQFRKRYGRGIIAGSGEAQELLRTRTAPLVLRRLKTTVARELPPKVESIVRCDMLPAQRALYDHVAAELRRDVARKIDKQGIARTHLDILAALTRLRQIACDPSLLPAPPGLRVPGSAKLALFEELMREALASERRIVVFSQFVQMQKRIIAVIEALGVTPLWLHGGTRHRDRVIAAFQDPQGPPVIVVSLKAGGTGITLTRADTVMHYDPWWNPAVEQQATDRTHRLGQLHQVNVYKLVCADSIEERVLDMAARKLDLANALLSDTPGASAKRISQDDVLALLS